MMAGDTSEKDKKGYLRADARFGYLRLVFLLGRKLNFRTARSLRVQGPRP
jgi:hypothetical protein